MTTWNARISPPLLRVIEASLSVCVEVICQETEFASLGGSPMTVTMRGPSQNVKFVVQSASDVPPLRRSATAQTGLVASMLQPPVWFAGANGARERYSQSSELHGGPIR